MLESTTLRKIDRLGYDAPSVVPPMLVTLVLGVGQSHELVVSAVGANGLRRVPVNRVKTEVGAPVRPWEFRDYLKRILLLIGQHVQASTDTVVRIMFIEVLECVLCETHSLLIRMLLLKELLSGWIVISQYDLSRLPLNVYHLSITGYPSAILSLARAELRLGPHSIRRNILIEALRLLLTFHPGIVALLHPFVSHSLLLAQLTLGVHGDVPVVLKVGRLFSRGGACFCMARRVVDD